MHFRQVEKSRYGLSFDSTMALYSTEINLECTLLPWRMLTAFMFPATRMYRNATAGLFVCCIDCTCGLREVLEVCMHSAPAVPWMSFCAPALEILKLRSGQTASQVLWKYIWSVELNCFQIISRFSTVLCWDEEWRWSERCLEMMCWDNANEGGEWRKDNASWGRQIMR